MSKSIGWIGVLGVCVAMAGCTWSRPNFVPPDVRVGESAFVRSFEAHTLAGLVDGNRVKVLLNGDEIFPSMLEAIRGAKTTITFANFMYEDGEVAREIAAALAERCRAGVGVSVLLDSVGSGHMPKELKTMLKDSGCHLAFYHPLNPLSFRRVNHRNHRRILVVDGRVGFTGGTGIGDKWAGDGRHAGHWRQTDVRVEGPIVRFLQAAFVENWRDATGLLLAGDAYFPEPEKRGAMRVQSVKSSPAAGAAEAFLLFLLAIEGARSSIHLTSPYFVPDRQIGDALVRAAQRGVDVSILTAGVVDTTLDRLVRKASQAHYGKALEAGVKIYEYTSAFLHAKSIVVDGQWVSIGSANLDNRSFALNDELNLAFLDRGLAEQLTKVFQEDLQHAERVTLEGWQRSSYKHIFYVPLIPLRDQL